MNNSNTKESPQLKRTNTGSTLNEYRISDSMRLSFPIDLSDQCDTLSLKRFDVDLKESKHKSIASNENNMSVNTRSMISARSNRSNPESSRNKLLEVIESQDDEILESDNEIYSCSPNQDEFDIKRFLKVEKNQLMSLYEELKSYCLKPKRITLEDFSKWFSIKLTNLANSAVLLLRKHLKEAFLNVDSRNLNQIDIEEFYYLIHQVVYQQRLQLAMKKKNNDFKISSEDFAKSNDLMQLVHGKDINEKLNNLMLDPTKKFIDYNTLANQATKIVKQQLDTNQQNEMNRLQLVSNSVTKQVEQQYDIFTPEYDFEDEILMNHENSQTRDLRDEIDLLKEEIESKKSQIQDMKVQMKGCEDRCSSMIQAYKDEEQKLNKYIQELEEKITDLAKMRTKKKEQQAYELSTYGKKSSQREEDLASKHEEIVYSLNEKLDDSYKSINVLNQKLNQIQNELTLKDEELKMQSSTNKEIIQENDAFNQRLNQLSDSYEHLRNENIKLSSDRIDLLSKLEIMEVETDNQKSDKNKTTNENENLYAKIKMLETENNQIQKERSSEKKKIDVEAEKNSKLLYEKNECVQRIEMLETEKNQIRKENVQLESEKQELESNVNKLDKELLQLTFKVEELQGVISQLNSDKKLLQGNCGHSQEYSNQRKNKDMMNVIEVHSKIQGRFLTQYQMDKHQQYQHEQRSRGQVVILDSRFNRLMRSEKSTSRKNSQLEGRSFINSNFLNQFGINCGTGVCQNDSQQD